MFKYLSSKYIEYSNKYPVYAKIARYTISGCTAAFTNIGLLYVLTDFIGVWYVLSEIISFIVAFMISFTLQKYWAFQDRSQEGVHRQAISFFVVAIFNLLLNTALIYILVEYLHLHYVVAQFLIGILIAVENFFLYQFLIFNKKNKAVNTSETLHV